MDQIQKDYIEYEKIQKERDEADDEQRKKLM
jgi:hypothetical protein